MCLGIFVTIFDNYAECQGGTLSLKQMLAVLQQLRIYN